MGGDFKRGGVEALKTSPAPGPVPVKAEAALRVATPLLEAPVADRHNWTLARLIGEIEAREGVTISKSRLSKVLRQKKVPLAPTATHPEGPPGRRGGSMRARSTPAERSAGGAVLPRFRRQTRPRFACGAGRSCQQRGPGGFPGARVFTAGRRSQEAFPGARAGCELCAAGRMAGSGHWRPAHDYAP